MPLEFGVLGETVVLAQAHTILLGHAMQRSVMNVLLVEPNRPHPVDRLVERVWGERATRAAKATLYSYLSRLRHILTPMPKVHITRRDSGYVLNVDETTIDLYRFRSLVSSARRSTDETALPLLDSALALWRGEALTDLTSPWADHMRTALEYERMAAERHRIDAGLRLGMHLTLLPDLAALATDHPLDEHLAGSLMLALTHCGRRAEALAHYHTLYHRLDRELGIVPGSEVRKIHREILSGTIE
ncbi:AfsR/SARP family transcriptional regulator [Actinosynnema sp. NPDC002837]